MPTLISSSDLLAIADRAAQQYALLSAAVDSINAAGTHGLYENIVTATDNTDLEVATMASFIQVDRYFEIDNMIHWGTPMSGIITGLWEHFNTLDNLVPLQVGGWDGYLYDNNVRVSNYFDKFYNSIMATHLLAVNVFSEGNDLFGSATINGSGVVTFTAGVSYGDGSRNNYAGSTYYAATQLRIKVLQVGSTNVTLDLRVKDKDNLLETLSITIPADTTPNTFFDIGITSDRCLAVTNISLGAGSGYTSGDSFQVYNKKERQILL